MATALPKFTRPNDDAERRRMEEEARRRFLESQSQPAPAEDPERLPVYSDTEAGPAGDFQEVQSLPRYAEPVNSEQTPAPQPVQQQSQLPVYRPPAASANASPDAARALPTFNSGSIFQPDELKPDPVPINENAPLMVARDKHGAPTDRVIGDGTELQKEEAELRAQEKYKPKSHNSRLKSILIGGGRGFLRGGILGSIFGAISHGVDPSLDEQAHRDRRIGELEQNVAGEYGRQKAASTLADQDVERRVKLQGIVNQTNTANRRVYEDERDAALKNLEQFPALDPKNPIHAGAIQRAQAAGWKIDPGTWGKNNVQIAFDVNSGTGVERDPLSKTWKPMMGADGKPISTRMPEKLGDLPKHFYELDGTNKDTIYSEAKAKAGGRDFSRGFQIDPAKVALLQKEGEKPEDTISRIKAMLNQGYDEAGNPIHFSEFARVGDQDSARRYDAAVEALAAPPMKKLNLYQLAVDQTVYSPGSAQLMSIDQFQKDYKTFWKKYTEAFKASPDQAEAMRAEYFNYIKGIRLR